MRLFFGIGIPASHRARVAQIQSLLRRDLQDVRWIPSENLHVTLRFLGDMPDEGLPELCSAATDACEATPAFAIRLRGAGEFPSRGRPRAVWIGVEEVGGGLHALTERLDASLLPGLGERRRPFQPHLTLGRPRRGFRGDITAALDGLGDVDLGAVEVDHVHLYESRLSPEGARYEIVSSFPLQPRRSS